MDRTGIDEFGRLRPQLLSFAMRRLRNREQAEDAVQETLVAALEGLERFAGGSSVRTWLIGILKHKIVDCVRVSAREQPLEDAESVAHDGHPEDALLRRRLVEAVARGLTELPVKAALAFVLREVKGLETGELCRELAISRSHCWVMLHRARRRLRDCPGIRNLAADAI